MNKCMYNENGKCTAYDDECIKFNCFYKKCRENEVKKINILIENFKKKED